MWRIKEGERGKGGKESRRLTVEQFESVWAASNRHQQTVAERAMKKPVVQLTQCSDTVRQRPQGLMLFLGGCFALHGCRYQNHIEVHPRWIFQTQQYVLIQARTRDKFNRCLPLPWTLLWWSLFSFFHRELFTFGWSVLRSFAASPHLQGTPLPGLYWPTSPGASSKASLALPVLSSLQLPFIPSSPQ